MVHVAPKAQRPRLGIVSALSPGELCDLVEIKNLHDLPTRRRRTQVHWFAMIAICKKITAHRDEMPSSLKPHDRRIRSESLAAMTNEPFECVRLNGGLLG